MREPDVMTRVTEYVEKIKTYVEKIIENGYANDPSNMRRAPIRVDSATRFIIVIRATSLLGLQIKVIASNPCSLTL